MSIKKVHYNDRQVRAFVHSILRGMDRDAWRPDYVVGLTRGGLVAANMISQYLDCRMETLNVSLRDSKDQGPESNLWMSEDAFGYVSYDDPTAIPKDAPRHDVSMQKNILVVDDINDSGATLNWIKNDWQSSCLPNNPQWEEVWNKNVRFAVLVDNQASEFHNIDYAGTEINKAEEDCWIVFPWEQWWE